MERTIYALGCLIVIASLGIIPEAQGIRFCSFCDTTSPAICERSTGKCIRPAKCVSNAMQRCERNDDLCLSSWRFTAQGLSIFSGCFPLPPHSKRTDYSKNCKPWQRNGTYTCLCRRNGCNKYPASRQTVSISTRYQATTTRMVSRRGTISVLASVKVKNVGSLGRGTSWMNMVTRWILIACIGSLVLVFSLLIYYIRTKNNHKNSIKNEPNDIKEKGPLGESDNRSDVQKPVIKSVIVKGKNSTVWRGFFNGKVVAVKYFPRSEESLWQNECSIYSKCTPGHENILEFIAASDFSDLNQNWLATSFYEQGSLQDYLTAHTLTWDRLLTMAKCITAGLSFLHSERLPDGKSKPAIAHQDLKSKNILVGNDGTCVLADFGLSMDLSQGYLSQVYKNGQVGAYRCMAPEKLEARIDVENTESFKQIDVYSLALVLWELLSRCHITEEPEKTNNICTNFTLPFEDVVGCSPTLEQMTKAVVVNGCRPSLPVGLSCHQSKDDVKYLWTTIKECWDMDPEARLTAACVHTRLTSLFS